MKGYLPNLDVLRLFLALEVAYAHCLLVYPVEIKPMILIPPVPAFLCISGYLIPASLARSIGYREFVIKRVLRIYPAMIASLVLVAILFGLSSIASVLLVYVTMGLVGKGVNQPLWSLMLEEVIYFFHAITRKIFTPLFAAIMMMIAIAAGYYVLNKPIGRISLGYGLITPVACFFAGNLLYFYRGKANVRIALVAFVSLVILAIWVPFPRDPIKVTVLGTLALIVALALPQLRVSYGKWWDASYGVYVYHWPIMVLFATQSMRGWQLVCWVLTVTMILGLLSWRLIEKPALQLKQVWGRPKPSVPAADEADPSYDTLDHESTITPKRDSE